MFKFAVLCAFLAAVTAEPSGLGRTIYSTFGYASNIEAPATTVISSYPNNLFYSSAPLAYSTPLGYSHLIKKRSAPLAVSSYIAPSAYFASAPFATTYAAAHLTPTFAAAAPLTTTYAAAAPLATTYTTAGHLATTYSSPFYAGAAHLIKKRSAAYIAPSTFVPSIPYSAVTPYYTYPYAAAGPYVPAPLISSSPLAFNTHFIKKRSAGLAAYAAPASYSHTSRFDFQTASPAITYTSYAGPAPLSYAHSFAFPQYLK
ncbi:pupal cuticle protein G1A-like [Vanessa cardui]|uniref:pupal cuticle protein G1A-like n=1 Tax=Vanessa cardui TaxID=171605 RepID=UPI001F14764E|nr:pupal cuticle protein G1A-like [Vanessa cardui]